MNTKRDAREIAVSLLARSACIVQVAAVIEDSWGPHAWGWNSTGPDGLGEHAEAMALKRANRARLDGATITVASQWKSKGKPAVSLPCPSCWALLAAAGVRTVRFRDRQARWRTLPIQAKRKVA